MTGREIRILSELATFMDVPVEHLVFLALADTGAKEGLPVITIQAN